MDWNSWLPGIKSVEQFLLRQMLEGGALWFNGCQQGGADGVFYQKRVLARAPGAELPKVVSEGEQRWLSIAAFFAKLSTADDPSGMDSLTSLNV